MDSKNVRVRFAPSPTGFVHIGNIRTALFGYLFARHEKGTFILRIEDTDRNRLVEGAVEHLLSVMEQLGIVPDEGFYLDDNGQVKTRGEYGPYLQSERLPIYQKHVLQLIQDGKAYYCFCSEKRLEELRIEQTALKKPPMYDRHCRGLNKDEVEAERARVAAEGRNPVVRQVMPLEGQTVIHDKIFGTITYENKTLDDQILLKSDGFPTYHLAVVVDDHLMQITHVTRTEEWIPSTPKHLLLYQAFGWEPPMFAHLPLVLNPDKTKLSKRQGDVSTESFLKKGYLREALINFLAFLGWNPKTEQEIFSIEELIAQFDLAKVNKAGAVFDVNKLDWINGLYIRKMSNEAVAEKLVPYWTQDGYLEQQAEGYFLHGYQQVVSLEYLALVASLEKERLKKFSEIGERSRFYFHPPIYDPAIVVWKKSTPEQTKANLLSLAKFLETISTEEFTITNLESKIKEFIAEQGADNGSVLWPMRVALTGLEKSPTPFEVASVLAFGLGKKEVVKRLELAANLL
ncbi:MAG TPA: glutamate--tRNA ligase [Patescibacteria group bacterium]|nr:glutamate--tRNA ligase [Patescibacteria group bacterium]